MSRPAFPGAVSTTLLRVYDWPAPDGVGAVGSGSPHLHTVSSEAYVVLAGRGAVHTVTPAGSQVHDLRPGTAVWFSPGTVHRAVNDGGLEVLVVMSDAGLPEAGDAVLTFPRDVLVDPARYRAAATLPVGDDAQVAAAARRRRDLAVQGMAELLEDVARIGAPEALARLHELAGMLVRPSIPGWRQTWETSALAGVQLTDAALTGLARGDVTHLAGAAVGSAHAGAGAPTYGMCGRLQAWPR
jgi:mannose-6-phosphate isomerase-like protein (cupin superfamily)